MCNCAQRALLSLSHQKRGTIADVRRLVFGNFAKCPFTCGRSELSRLKVGRLTRPCGSLSSAPRRSRSRSRVNEGAEATSTAVTISKSPSAEQDFVSVDRELCDSHHCYAINLDIERPRPRGNVQKDARRGLRRKVSRINIIELLEVRLIGGAIYVALHNALQ